MLKSSLIIGTAIFLLLVLLFSGYSNTFYSQPVMDDFHSFVDEPNVQIESLDAKSFQKLTKTEFGYARLIPMATFAWDFFWGKGHIWAFHVTNFVIHLLCVIGMFFFLNVLFLCDGGGFYESNSSKLSGFWLTFCVVGLWALSPVQTNAVTYLVQRMTSLATLFYLISVTCYLRARICQLQNKSLIKTIVFYLLALFAAMGTFLSKEISATLPVVIFILEVMFFTPDLFLRIRERKRIFWTLVILCLFVSFVIVTVFLPRFLGGFSGRHFTLGERLLTELRVVSSYIFLLLLPLPRFMNFEYDVSISTSLVSPLSTISSLIFLSFLLAVAWKMRRNYRLISFGIVWFFINLLIESTVIPLELKFEHRLYLPSIGFFLALVLGIKAIAERLNFVDLVRVEKNKVVMISLMVIVFSALSVLTYIRNMCWADNLTLYADCVCKAPGKARNHVNLSRAYALAGDYDKAIVEGETALAVGQKGYEEYWAAVGNIMSAYTAQGKLKQAIKTGEFFLTGDIPEGAKQNCYPLILNDLGLLNMQLGEYSAAYNYFLRAFKFMLLCDDLPYLPRFEADLLHVMEKVYSEQDDLAGEIGLDLHDKSSVYRVMADLFYKAGRYDRALYYCKLGMNENLDAEWCSVMQKRIKHDIKANQIQLEKGTLKKKYLYHFYKNKYNFYMAMAYLQEKLNISLGNSVLFFLDLAEEVNPASADISLLKSWYLYKLNKSESALRVIDQGIQLDPDYARLWVNRAIYALSVGHHKEALTAANEVLALYPGYPYRNRIEAIKKAANFGLSRENLDSSKH